MQKMNLMRVDLNLLVVFDAVARNLSVTVAARELALSQPAVSHALNRLRAILGDALFVRSGKGLLLTHKAQAMVVSVKELLESAERIISPTGFDAATTARTFRIGASDFGFVAIVSRLMNRVRVQAPSSLLEIAAVDADLATRIEKGEIDLAFVGVLPSESRLISRELFRDHFIGLACERHPLAQKIADSGVQLEDYLAFPHAAVGFGLGGASRIDALLAEMGEKRRIGMISAHFGATIASLAGTDLLMSLPSRMALASTSPGLVRFEIPLAIPDFPYFMIWHRRSDADPASQWLRDLVVASVMELQSPELPKACQTPKSSGK